MTDTAAPEGNDADLAEGESGEKPIILNTKPLFKRII